MARNKYDVDEVLEDKFDLNQLKRLLAYLFLTGNGLSVSAS